MGIGDPAGVLEVIERGVDMFDCVLPTRLGRTGSALTWEGRLNLKNARFARDERRSTKAAPAPRAALLARVPPPSDQPTGAARLVFLSLHNLRFLLDLTAGARAAIERGEFGGYKAPTLDASTRRPPARRTRSMVVS